MKPERVLTTVLFTDIVGSTERAAEVGDARWRELLQAHHALTRRELERFGGVELATTGDGFLAGFPSPDAALHCACAVRDGVRRLGMEIRAGLHTGEVERIEHTVGGLAVHIGARVAAEAAPGEILVSATTRDLVAGSGFGFEERGIRELKGVPGEWGLHAVTSSPLRLPASSLRSRLWAARPGWLPHRGGARAVLAGLAGFSLLVGVAGVWFLTAGREGGVGPRATEAAPAPAVAVLPFRVVGEETQLWREGMVDLISTNLDGAGGLRSLDPRVVIGRWRRIAGEDGDVAADALTLDPQALGMARELGAHRAVTGSLVALGGEVRLSARIYDVADGRVVGQAEARGSPDSIPVLVDRLSVDVLHAVAPPAAGVPAAELRRISTPSLPALKAYLEGEQAFRRLRFLDALDHFARAVDEDSTFALALYRLALTQGWLEGGTPSAVAQLDRAARFAERLPEREVLLLRGTADVTPASIAILERLTSRYPDDVEAWYALGDRYFHAGPAVLIPLGSAARSFRRALELDPTFGPAYIHLLDDAFMREDSADAWELVRSYGALEATGPEVAGSRLAFDITWGGPGARAAALDALGAVEPETVVQTLGLLRYAPRAWERGPLPVRQLADKLASPSERTSLLVSLTIGRLSRGQARAWGRELLELAEGASSVGAARYLLAYRIAGFGDSLSVRTAAAALADDSSPIDRLLLGALAADEGRWGDVEVHLRALRSRPPPDERPDEPVPHDRRAVGELLGAYRAVRLNPVPATLETLADALGRADGFCPGSGCAVHAALRFELGRLLLEGGDPETAARYLESVEVFYGLSPAALYLGRIAEIRGDLGTARERYADFVRRWRDCDPELRPLWTRARRSLDSLEGRPRP